MNKWKILLQFLNNLFFPINFPLQIFVFLLLNNNILVVHI